MKEFRPGDKVVLPPYGVGVVAGIGAWNYPMQTACWKTAPALAFGPLLGGALIGGAVRWQQGGLPAHLGQQLHLP